MRFSYIYTKLSSLTMIYYLYKIDAMLILEKTVREGRNTFSL